jgi:hypothetical protein
MVHLRDQWTYRVDNVTASLAGKFNYLWSRTMSRKHDGHADRNLRNIIDENDSQLQEAIYYCAIVHDLVVAVDGSRERAHHPSKCFDCHFYTRTKPTWGSEQDAINAAYRFRQIVHLETQYCSVFHA